MKLVQIITILFCLGIFLIPKDNFYIQTSQGNCCKSDSKKDCCKSNHKDHNNDEKETKSSCNNSVCSTYIALYTSLEAPLSRGLCLDIYSGKDSSASFHYSAPHLSDRLKDIWQPPKIG